MYRFECNKNSIVFKQKENEIRRLLWPGFLSKVIATPKGPGKKPIIHFVACPQNNIDKLTVETGNGIPPRRDQNRREIAALPIHPFASAEERRLFGQVFVNTYQNDLYPFRKVSAPFGHGETGASFWQAQRAGPRLRETIKIM